MADSCLAAELCCPLPADELLRHAQRLVADEARAGNWLADVAEHLIACSAEVVALMPKGDLDAAREALGAARAAVGVATYAVRRLHDDDRSE
ncbi:MAG TPA: hypothetical protein VGG25_25015 [Streptosporangiaceae bacterium]